MQAGGNERLGRDGLYSHAWPHLTLPILFHFLHSLTHFSYHLSHFHSSHAHPSHPLPTTHFLILIQPISLTNPYAHGPPQSLWFLSCSSPHNLSHTSSPPSHTRFSLMHARIMLPWLPFINTPPPTAIIPTHIPISMPMHATTSF